MEHSFKCFSYHWPNFSKLVDTWVARTDAVGVVTEMKKPFYIFPSVSTENLGHSRDAERPRP